MAAATVNTAANPAARTELPAAAHNRRVDSPSMSPRISQNPMTSNGTPMPARATPAQSAIAGQRHPPRRTLTAGREPVRIAFTPGQLAAGFAILAGLVVLLAGRRAGRRDPSDRDRD